MELRVLLLAMLPAFLGVACLEDHDCYYSCADELEPDDYAHHARVADWAQCRDGLFAEECGGVGCYRFEWHASSYTEVAAFCEGVDTGDIP